MGDEEQQPRKKMSCGYEYCTIAQLSEQLQTTINNGFHFIVIPVVHPRYKRELLEGKALDRQEPLSRSDLILSTQDWSRLIVGKISPYFELDSEIEHVRRTSEEQFCQELEFVTHLSIPAILLKLRPGTPHVNMARILNSKLNSHINISYQVWVEVPLMFRKTGTNCEAGGDHVNTDMWEIWNKFRVNCDFDKRVSLALELTRATEVPDEAELARWFGEPIKCLIINTDLFITNNKNYPVLSRALQELIRKFMQLDIQYIIRGKNRHTDISQYNAYVSYLGKKLYTHSEFTEYSAGCEDFLQNPLQPLSDNLENMVYDVFEKDPHKYNQYQLAIQKALEDKKMDRAGEDIVVMVVGAGRGPLIRAVLNAREITGCSLKVYAIEKNPHAINTLHALVRELWPGQVTVFFGDMRSFTPDEKADILVSELLGSFGDNELSPECLDGAQRFLKDDGISIPTSYSSWLEPIHSIKLYSEIKYSRTVDKPPHFIFETPYVVHIVNFYRIDCTKELFTFKHPNKNKVIDNRRYEVLRYRCSQNCVLTGFAGYFTCDLYKGVMISTEPKSHTTNMTSWFPILFPISEPLQLKAGDPIEIAFWRCMSDTKVWYEWCVLKPKPGNIHNVNGRSSKIKK